MRSTFVLALVSTAAAVLVSTSPSIARADAAGDKLLAAVDAAMNRAKTLQFEYEVRTQELGKLETVGAMNLLQKGDKRLFEYLAPGPIKGTRVLVLSASETYAYLPGFGKVRKVASHTSTQGFMGMAFSQDDLANQALLASYSAKIAAEDDTSWTLTLAPRVGKEAAHARIDIVVAKDRNLPAELRYFNSEGKHIKTETRSDYTCEGDVCSATEIQMTDLVQGNRTRLKRKSWKVNESVSDDAFSKRSLGE